MAPIMDRWTGSCRRELLDQTLIRNLRHLMIVLRELEDSCSTHWRHRALNQAAPVRPLPGSITDLKRLRASGVTAPAASSTKITRWHRFSAQPQRGLWRR
jgi:hypothetical protein